MFLISNTQYCTRESSIVPTIHYVKKLYRYTPLI